MSTAGKDDQALSAHGFKYKVFFAIPFDTATKSMYVKIIEDLEKEFPNNFVFSIGTTSVITPSGDYSEIEEFKAQNQDFLTRFHSLIESSDVLIADLTNQNASVHLELGIALTLNKNILRVSGRDLNTMASDLRGYEVKTYTDGCDLFGKIRNYLAFFLHIKTRPLTLVIPGSEEIKANTTEFSAPDSYVPRRWPIAKKLRDGEIRFKFAFKEFYSDVDWFAVLLRAETSNPWLGGGYFIFVRANGELRVRRMTTVEPLQPEKDYRPLEKTEHIFHVVIDGNHLFASVDEDPARGVHVQSLENQSPGDVALGCYRSFVQFRYVELIHRDTITFR